MRSSDWLHLVRRFLAAVALAAAVADPRVAGAPAPNSLAKALFLRDVNRVDARAADEAVVARLRASHWEVTALDQDAPPPGLSGFNLILISGTVRAHGIDDRYRNAAQPIVTWQPAILEDLGMTGRIQEMDYGNENKRGGSLYFFVVNAPHPLAAGLDNGLWTVFNDTQKSLSWGRPGPGAIVIATLPGEPQKAALFAYEQGAMMSGDFSAPARRVSLFLNPQSFTFLDEHGLRLFDEAVAWAATPPVRARGADEPPSAGVPGRHRLLFVKNSTLAPVFLSADINAERRLRAEGYAITEASEADCVQKTPGHDLIVVSSTVEAHDVGAKFRDTPLPVVTWEGYLLNHMRMTGKRQDIDFGCDLKDSVTTLRLVNAPHPIAAGMGNGWFWPYQLPSKIRKIDWGSPGPGATVIATLAGEPQKAGIFCYEKGALMDAEFSAPGRRVMLFLHSESFDQLNAVGLKVFDAAIRWAADQSP